MNRQAALAHQNLMSPKAAVGPVHLLLSSLEAAGGVTLSKVSFVISSVQQAKHCRKTRSNGSNKYRRGPIR